MKVTVKYWAQVREAAGTESEAVELTSPCSAQELVQRLANEHGDPLRSFLLDSEGRLRKPILLILGDRHIGRDTSVALSDGDELTILPPISGGGSRAPD